MVDGERDEREMWIVSTAREVKKSRVVVQCSKYVSMSDQSRKSQAPTFTSKLHFIHLYFYYKFERIYL